MTTDLMRSAIPETQVCPGSCNRNYRSRPDAFDPVYGEPVWCPACTKEISSAIGALPDLAVALWDIGHWSTDPMQDVVARTIDVVEVWSGQVLVTHLREKLACGHFWPTVTRPRVEDLPPPAAQRACWLCAIDDPGGDGRVAPAPALARRGPRLKGSPAGSASYLAIDELVMWAARTEDYLKARLPQPSSPAPDPRSVNDAHRSKVLSSSCAFLVEWIYHLLATPHAKALGKEALDLERRARRSSGVDVPPDQHLPGVPCPGCDHVSLKRLGRVPDQVTCTSCGRWFQDDELDDEGRG